MKQYVVDELRPGDYRRIKSFLDKELGPSGVPGLYKLPVDSETLDGLQIAHIDCQPFYFAIDLEPERLASELLVRTDSRIGCDCMAYATEAQRNRLIQFTDGLLHKLDISV